MCSSFRSVAVATTAVARSGLTQKVGIQVEGKISTQRYISSFLQEEDTHWYVDTRKHRQLNGGPALDMRI